MARWRAGKKSLSQTAKQGPRKYQDYSCSRSHKRVQEPSFQRQPAASREEGNKKKKGGGGKKRQTDKGRGNGQIKKGHFRQRMYDPLKKNTS